MEELICNECKGRKFQKISDSEYECQYCGAIIKEVRKPEAPKVVIVQQSVQPTPVVTPFPPEVSYVVTLRLSFMDALIGKLFIYPDKFAFTPDSSFVNKLCWTNQSTREWKISDIAGYVKGMLALMHIKMKDGTKIKLSVNNKNTIINALEERRKYWLERK